MNESCSSLRVLLKHLRVLMVAGPLELYILLNCCRCHHEAKLAVFFLMRRSQSHPELSVRVDIPANCTQRHEDIH